MTAGILIHALYDVLQPADAFRHLGRELGNVWIDAGLGCFGGGGGRSGTGIGARAGVASGGSVGPIKCGDGLFASTWSCLPIGLAIHVFASAFTESATAFCWPTSIQSSFSFPSRTWPTRRLQRSASPLEVRSTNRETLGEAFVRLLVLDDRPLPRSA